MPELPEVESVAAYLRQLLPEHTIEQAVINRAKLIPAHTPEEFCDRLKGATFTDIGRRGKHILLHLDSSDTLIVHLRMSGRFLYVDQSAELPKFTHAIFALDENKLLAFQDQRHFGMMHLVKTDELHQAKELSSLAPEPLGPDFTLEYLTTTLSKSKRAIKEVLLDQTKVLGLGNIYAAEALFAARIHPELPASKVTSTQLEDLHPAIQAILEAAIEAGSTIHTNPEDIAGGYFGNSFEEALAVYDREDEPCWRCETPIERIRQGQRSTYFCPTCQKNAE
ncbi:MAG TPA: bifunctional DNA-formamidopyrimidine glycosylase/DNA-(apurinic or apyrimidinic site) lyase [Acidobacteriota bacterium]|nr:bifunctional DNA-formamidopyrimidine glycosylase/DNA-(apurinic or apyrimidinic site) lyase [Acidobacteriota bacterium]HNG93084.1 bifunctional DNA-formamidopyrimidine glycosylase/DNA-(apurinic or apyrimidinic site) lyase [Acidobacteriota bacterium]